MAEIDLQNFWEQWPLPWNEEQARLAYIQSPRKLTFEFLAEKMGCTERTVQNIQYRTGEDWGELRKEFFKEVRKQSAIRTAEKTADYISNYFEKQLKYHFETLRNYHTAIRVHSRAIKEQFEEWQALYDAGEIDLKEFVKRVHSIKGIEMLNWIKATESVINLERTTLGLDYYQSLDKSQSALENAGYVVMTVEAFQDAIMPSEKAVLVEGEG